MTLDELAVGLRRSKRTVQTWIAQGVIPRDGTLLECALAALDHFTEAAAGRRGASGGTLDLAQERALLAREQRIAEELRNAERRGELIPAADADHGFVALATAVSGRLQGVGVAIAQQLMSESSASGCQSIVDEAIAEALNDLADAGQKAAARITKSDGAPARSPKRKRLS